MNEGPGLLRSSADYLYDHDRRRVRKTVSVTRCGNSSNDYQCSPGTTETLYPYADYEVHGPKSRVHIYADSLHVATAEWAPCGQGSDHGGCGLDLYFHHDDHLGGASVVTDDQGEQVQLLDYFPFGLARLDEQTGIYNSTQNFTGHELDDATGLHYAGARYYGSAYGRFVSQDPLQWSIDELHGRFAANPQGLNYYSYALNNPLVLTEPTGEWAFSAFLNPAAYAGAAAAAAAGAYYLRDALDEFGRAIGGIIEKTSEAVRDITSPPTQKPPREPEKKPEKPPEKTPEKQPEKTSPPKLPTKKEDPQDSGPPWSSRGSRSGPENAVEHFEKHGSEFPEFRNATQYSRGAKDFVTNPPSGTLTKVRPDGDKLFYDPASNTLGVQRADGAIRTLFRPTGGMNYWKRL